MNKQKQKEKLVNLIYVLIAFILIEISFVSAFNWNDNTNFAYWSFTNSSSVVNSSYYNLTAIKGYPTFPNGIIGTGSKHNMSNGNSWEIVQDTNEIALNRSGQNFTISFWINATTFSANQFLISHRYSTGYYISLLNTGSIQATGFGTSTDLVSTSGLALNKWTHVVLLKNTTSVCLFFNASMINCLAKTGNVATVNAGVPVNYTIGSETRAGGSGVVFNGTLDEMGLWTRNLSIAEIVELYNGGSGLAYGQSTSTSTVTNNNPLNNTQTTSNTIIDFNCSATDTGTISNITLYINGIQNYTYHNPTAAYLELIKSYQLNANSYNYFCEAKNSLGGVSNSSTFYFNVTNYIQNSVTYNSTTNETKGEKYTLNVTGDGLQTLTAELVYDGTTYTTSKEGNDWNATFTGSIDVPTVNGVTSKNFYFILHYGGTTYNTATYSQTVNPIYFASCNSTLTVPYYNVSFFDETSLLPVSASINSQFQFYMGSGSVKKSYSFQNTSYSPSNPFCFSAANVPLYIIPYIQYGNATAQTRIYSITNPLYLTNIVTNKTLYTILTTNGIYSSYQVVRGGSLSPISGATIMFDINGNVIEQLVTDNSGVATFFLNPNQIYALNVSSSGHNSYSAYIYPTQTQYTITLSTNTVSNITSYAQGISIVSNPIDNYLTNNTNYNFNVTLTSSYLSLDSWGFNISNGTTVVYSNTGGTGGLGNLGTLSTSFDTDNYSTLTMTIFWEYNGTLTTSNRYYTIENLAGSQWSIYNGIIDLKSYVSTGFFGLTPIGMNLIIFVIIFVSTGLICYKFGLYSPLSVSLVLLSLVFIFDVVFGLIYYDPTTVIGKAVPHITTVLIGLITLALGIKEGTSY